MNWFVHFVISPRGSDVFLAKDDDEYICGWHVDDWGFWPATPSSIGINAWIAIDDLPVNDGGGFALAVGSHVAPWRHDAYRATGATPTYPQEGFNSAADMFAKRSGGGTCNLKKVAPKINQLMEDRKRVYDVKRGDVIFHTRWLFHRTVPFHRDVVENAFRTSGRTHLPLLHRRFSIRYVPGTSRLPSGYGMEPSVLWNETNAGQLINDVVANSGPWYPQCWPSPLCTELSELNDLVKNKLPICDERQRERKREMMPYLQAIGRKNREQQAKA